MKTKLLHSLFPIFGLLLFSVVLRVLHYELKVYHLLDILQQLGEEPRAVKDIYSPAGNVMLYYLKN